MRVLIAGYDPAKINSVAITTFLNGLYNDHKNNLCIIFYGEGYISDIVEEWIHKTWPGPSPKNCFNLDWVIKHWSGDEIEGIGDSIIKESKPDLAFLFGYDKYKIQRYLQYASVPTFLVEKL